MECVNCKDFEELLNNLSHETIEKIIVDVRYITNDKYGFRLPEPKNNSERIAMEKFLKHYINPFETSEDLSSRPRVFPFLWCAEE